MGEIGVHSLGPQQKVIRNNGMFIRKLNDRDHLIRIWKSIERVATLGDRSDVLGGPGFAIFVGEIELCCKARRASGSSHRDGA